MKYHAAILIIIQMLVRSKQHRSPFRYIIDLVGLGVMLIDSFDNQIELS